MTDNRPLKMEDIMEASLGEVSNKLTVKFKKTVQVKQYETETIEAMSSVNIDDSLTGIERMFVTSIIAAQMEYTTFCSLAVKGYVTGKELQDRKKELEDVLYSLKYKADEILGPGKIDKYIKDTNLDKKAEKAGSMDGADRVEED